MAPLYPEREAQKLRLCLHAELFCPAGNIRLAIPLLALVFARDSSDDQAPEGVTSPPNQPQRGRIKRHFARYRLELANELDLEREGISAYRGLLHLNFG